MDEKGDVEAPLAQITPFHQHEEPVCKANNCLFPAFVVVPLLLEDIPLKLRPNVLQREPCNVDQRQEIEKRDNERNYQQLHVVHLVEGAETEGEEDDEE